MNIITTRPTMDKSEIVQRGVDIFAKVEQALADAATGLMALHALHDDAYVASIISGTEAMEGRARVLQAIGIVGSAQDAVMAEHVFAAAKAQSEGIDIATPYAPLPPKISTRSGGGR